MKNDPSFSAQMKTIAMIYVRDAVAAIEIPDLTGSKDWGSYAIKGLKIVRFTLVKLAILC